MGIDPVTAAIGVGGAALGALSKPKSPKMAGGGIDPFLKPYLIPGLDTLKSQFQAGPQVFQGQRVADFDPAQLAAQSSLIALATGQPDYYAPAARSIEEAIALSRQAARPITAADIAAQRELLEPTAEAQRLAQTQAFEGAIRDVGLGAGGAGVGALEGARADILRGGAAGELALGLANIEGGLQERAITQAGAERDRQARLPSQLAALAQQGLQVGQEGYAEQAERIGLQAGVGAERRGLEQQRIGAEMAKFAEADPFKYTQQYLQTAFGTPTLPTQMYQPQSTAQSILGGLTAVSGFMNQGGAINSLNEGGSIFSKEEEDEIKEIEEYAKEMKETEAKEKKKTEATDKFKKGLKSLAKNSDALNPKQLIGQQRGRSTQVSMQQDARARARRRLGMFDEGGVVNKDEGGILSRIMDSVKSGYQALKDIDYDPETESLGKYDPFTGFDRTERLRIGLAMIGQMPELGQGPLQAAAAGATTALEQITAEQLTEEETARKAEADRLGAITTPEILPSAAFRNVESQIGVLYGAKVVRDATGQVIGIDQTGLDSPAQAKIAEDTNKAIKVMEQAYKNDPSTAYSVTLDYITNKLGPLK